MNIFGNRSIAKMRSAVPPAHHPSEWMGWVIFSLHSVRFRLVIWL